MKLSYPCANAQCNKETWLQARVDEIMGKEFSVILSWDDLPPAQRNHTWERALFCSDDCWTIWRVIRACEK